MVKILRNNQIFIVHSPSCHFLINLLHKVFVRNWRGPSEDMKTKSFSSFGIRIMANETEDLALVLTAVFLGGAAEVSLIIVGGSIGD